MTISSWESSPSIRSRISHDLDDRDMIALGFAAASPKTLTRHPLEAGGAAKLPGQLFQEVLEPFLPDRVAGLRQQDLDKYESCAEFMPSCWYISVLASSQEAYRS